MSEFTLQLHKIGMMQRKAGQQEFRIAVMRWLKERGLSQTAHAIGSLEVDEYLTPEEIAERERMP